MSRVLIFGGTTEGRELAETLERSKILCDLCVATPEGARAAPDSEFVRVHTGRLDASRMRALVEETRPEAVVDATHPYAALATATIRESLEGLNVPYLRLARPEIDCGNVAVYDSLSDCAAALRGEKGRVFLTTGSKELAPFCEDPELRARVVVRVLPSIDGLTRCFEAGLSDAQIIAARGPFTRETNEAMLRQYEIRFLVTKESGVAGGEDSKLAAARAVGVDVCVIRRPSEGGARGASREEVCARLEEILDVKLARAPLDVVLAGVGCGSAEGMTKEVLERVERSDFLFGAPRMLNNLPGNAIRKPFYLKKDVLPELARIRRERGGKKITVLFSGDSGFCSGCERLYPAIKELSDAKVRVMPGVSSVSALAARLGWSWDDAAILNLHGIDEAQWSGRLLTAARERRKTFFLTSGARDVRRVGELCSALPDADGTTRVFLGYRLSYDDEALFELTPGECARREWKEGLYVGAILQTSPTRRILTPSLADEDFVRGAVPMTKEKIRQLAICRLKLREGDALFDVGAGTGSVGLQAATTSPTIRVVAIERREEAIALIRENARRLNVPNIRIVQGEAPDAFEGLPRPDVAFLGGTGGKLFDILEKLRSLNSKIRIVATAATLETAAALNEAIKRFPVVDVDVSQVAVNQLARVGEYGMLRAGNPIFLFSFAFKEGD